MRTRFAGGVAVSGSSGPGRGRRRSVRAECGSGEASIGWQAGASVRGGDERVLVSEVLEGLLLSAKLLKRLGLSGGRKEKTASKGATEAGRDIKEKRGLVLQNCAVLSMLEPPAGVGDWSGGLEPGVVLAIICCGGGGVSRGGARGRRGHDG